MSDISIKRMKIRTVLAYVLLFLIFVSILNAMSNREEIRANELKVKQAGHAQDDHIYEQIMDAADDLILDSVSTLKDFSQVEIDRNEFQKDLIDYYGLEDLID